MPVVTLEPKSVHPDSERAPSEWFPTQKVREAFHASLVGRQLGHVGSAPGLLEKLMMKSRRLESLAPHASCQRKIYPPQALSGCVCAYLRLLSVKYSRQLIAAEAFA